VHHFTCRLNFVKIFDKILPINQMDLVKFLPKKGNNGIGDVKKYDLR